MSISGTQFAQQFLATPYRAGDGYSPAREALIVNAFAEGNVPDFVFKTEWLQIVTSAMIGGVVRSARLWVSPFLALGTDADPLYTAMTPQSAQAIANQFNAHILSKKLVRAYFDQAQLKLAIQVPGSPLKIPGPDMNKPEAIVAHSAQIRKASAGKSPAEFRIAGHSKNVVIGPRITNGRLAIYGGYTGVPGKGVDGWCYQSYPGPHPSDWVDYSQMVQLVFGTCEIDGVRMSTRAVFMDPQLNVLVSDQGAFDPMYPNASGGSGNPVIHLPPTPKPPITKPPTPTPPKAQPAGDGSGGPAITLAVSAIGALLLIRALTRHV